MKKYLYMSSAAVLIGALRVKSKQELIRLVEVFVPLTFYFAVLQLKNGGSSGIYIVWF